MTKNTIIITPEDEKHTIGIDIENLNCVIDQDLPNGAPKIAPHGHTFGDKAIFPWLKFKKTTNPCNNLPLIYEQLRDNNLVAQIISYVKSKNLGDKKTVELPIRFLLDNNTGNFFLNPAVDKEGNTIESGSDNNNYINLVIKNFIAEAEKKYANYKAAPSTKPATTTKADEFVIANNQDVNERVTLINDHTINISQQDQTSNNDLADARNVSKAYRIAKKVGAITGILTVGGLIALIIYFVNNISTTLGIENNSVFNLKRGTVTGSGSDAYCTNNQCFADLPPNQQQWVQLQSSDSWLNIPYDIYDDFSKWLGDFSITFTKDGATVVNQEGCQVNLAPPEQNGTPSSITISCGSTPQPTTEIGLKNANDLVLKLGQISSNGGVNCTETCYSELAPNAHQWFIATPGGWENLPYDIFTPANNFAGTLDVQQNYLGTVSVTVTSNSPTIASITSGCTGNIGPEKTGDGYPLTLSCNNNAKRDHSSIDVEPQTSAASTRSSLVGNTLKTLADGVGYVSNSVNSFWSRPTALLAANNNAAIVPATETFTDKVTQQTPLLLWTMQHVGKPIIDKITSYLPVNQQKPLTVEIKNQLTQLQQTIKNCERALKQQTIHKAVKLGLLDEKRAQVMQQLQAAKKDIYQFLKNNSTSDAQVANLENQLTNCENKIAEMAIESKQMCGPVRDLQTQIRREEKRCQDNPNRLRFK